VATKVEPTGRTFGVSGCLVSWRRALLWDMVAGPFVSPGTSPAGADLFAPRFFPASRSVPTRPSNRSAARQTSARRFDQLLSPVTRDFLSVMCDPLRWPQPRPARYPMGWGLHSPNRRGGLRVALRDREAPAPVALTSHPLSPREAGPSAYVKRNGARCAASRRASAAPVWSLGVAMQGHVRELDTKKGPSRTAEPVVGVRFVGGRNAGGSLRRLPSQARPRPTIESACVVQET
jgi:hypothetical protein